jgi:hypothetical protein
MKKWLLLLLAAPVLAQSFSCKKLLDNDTPKAVCDSIRLNSISGNHPLNIGDNLQLSVRHHDFDNDFVYTTWWGPNNFSVQDQHTIFLNNVGLLASGWYHVRLSSMNSGCEKIDSVFVSVAMPQGTPPCNLAVNTISYSNMGTGSILSVHNTVSLGLRELEANSVSGDVTLQFHPYWQNLEPIDGVYEITTDASGGQNNMDIQKVYMNAVASSIFFQANTPGQKVYISHVNGKLQAQFCNISMSGNNGMSWTTQISGTLRAQ